jgi:hypothetical protein
MKLTKTFLICLLLIAHSIGQERRRDEPISDELYEIVSKRSDSIRTEIVWLDDNEWAGVYADGDHHPTVFMWAPKNGYLVTSSLHTFSPSWVNFGKVKFENNLLTIFPELQADNKSAHKMSTEFVPVVWDQWHFLVPSDRLLEFAYAVHSKSESRIWDFFIKRVDVEKPRRGLPTLPAKYRKIMTMPAIVARIIKVEKVDDSPWSEKMTLDVGSKKGIVKGMQFYRQQKGSYVSISIVEVAKTTSVASISMVGSNSNKEIQIKKGWIFSSKMPKGFIEPG